MRSGNKLLLLLLLVSLSLRSWAENPNYNFNFVAMNGQTIDGILLSSSFNLTPCINDAGEILFNAAFEITPGSFGTGLFTPHHVIAKTGDTIDGHVLNGVSGCSINNSGSIVFEADLQGGKTSLVRKERGRPAKLLVIQGEKIDGLELQSFPSFSVNDWGETVFAANFKCHNSDGGIGIFTPHSVLVTPGSTVDGYLLSGIDQMIVSSTKHVYFHAYNANIGEGIFSLHQLLVKVGDTIGGFTFIPVGSSAFGYLASSRDGHLAFGATYDGGSGIFSPHRVLVSTSGQLPFPSAINDSGDFVYGGGSGLVLNQAPLFNYGDSIAGHILNGLALPPAINNRGAVVFMGNFGPDAGIVLASPKHRKW